jgi:hypothetical protein
MELREGDGESTRTHTHTCAHTQTQAARESVHRDRERETDTHTETQGSNYLVIFSGASLPPGLAFGSNYKYLVAKFKHGYFYQSGK